MRGRALLHESLYLGKCSVPLFLQEIAPERKIGGRVSENFCYRLSLRIFGTCRGGDLLPAVWAIGE